MWAFGCFAYELATGNPPFANIKKRCDLLDAIVNKPVPRISERWSATFQDFIDQCLKKKPSDRYSIE